MKKRNRLSIWIFSVFFALLGIGAADGGQDRAVLTLTDGEVSVVFRDAPVRPTDHLVAEEIFLRRINSPCSAKMELVKARVEEGEDFRSALLYCFPYLKAAVEEFVHKAYRPSVDAEISFDPDAPVMFSITPEKEGSRVNEPRLYRDIYYALCRSGKATVTAKKIVIRPEVSAARLKSETYLRARYTTDYSSSSAARKHNVRLALSKINGTVLLNGESFSFNGVVGKRSKENGYMEAKIIVGGRYEDGYGGGVCQASTTVYNAALLSGLTVTEARRHSLKVGYELPSFDAMVNSASSDLKFVNESGGRIFIKAYGTENKVCVEIYGQRLRYQIKRRSVTVKEGELPGYEEVIDGEGKYFEPGTASGSKTIVSYPHASLESEGYLDYYVNGRLVKSVLIRKDKYSGTMGVIAVMP